MLYISKAYDDYQACVTDTRTMREEYKTAKQLVALDKKGLFIYGLQAYNGKVFDVTPYSKIDFPTYSEALEYREYNRDIELYDAGGRYYGFVINNAFYHRYHFICRPDMYYADQWTYLGEGGRFTPYRQEAADFSEGEANVKARSMNKHSKTGGGWIVQVVDSAMAAFAAV